MNSTCQICGDDFSFDADETHDLNECEECSPELWGSDGISEQTLANIIGSLLTGEIDIDDTQDRLGYMKNESACTFADAGVLTMDKGIKLSLPNGQTAYIRVQVQEN